MKSIIEGVRMKSLLYSSEKGKIVYKNKLRVYESIEELDTHLNTFTEKLSKRSSDALTSLKKMFWEGTDHWEQLLEERAENSGRLVLSKSTKKIMEEFKTGK